MPTDTERLDFILPIMSLAEENESFTKIKIQLIAATLLMGRSGRSAIDLAIEEYNKCPMPQH